MFPVFGILTPAIGPATASAEAPFKKSFFGGACSHPETMDSASPAGREAPAKGDPLARSSNPPGDRLSVS